MESEINRIYGNRVRVRVCGLCWTSEGLLMVNHRLADNRDFWAPPGGGIEFGETHAETLIREFGEETNLKIVPGEFLFACEFIDRPLHAIELFFRVTADPSGLRAGSDPELPIITDARFLSAAEIASMGPETLHGIFRICPNADELTSLSGFYTL